jgi:predicted transcriptional regulator of viral defense system
MFSGRGGGVVGALTPSTAGQAGLSRSALYRGARAGRLDRIARGIYLPAEASAVDWDQLEAATRRPDATICLTSALAHHDLTDAIPAALDVAIPRGSRTPASTGAIAWHQFDRPTFEIGREQIAIPGSDQTIGIYSSERSIADAFRLRGAVGYELARDALREWLRRGGNPARLIDIASRLPRVRSPVLHALEMLG